MFRLNKKSLLINTLKFILDLLSARASGTGEKLFRLVEEVDELVPTVDISELAGLAAFVAVPAAAEEFIGVDCDEDDGLGIFVLAANDDFVVAVPLLILISSYLRP
jgi:hypothetical protein